MDQGSLHVYERLGRPNVLRRLPRKVSLAVHGGSFASEFEFNHYTDVFAYTDYLGNQSKVSV